MGDATSIFSHSPAVVFVNPAAGGGRARALLPRIRRVFESQGVSAKFVTTADSDGLETAARAAVREGTRVLLALGGDGTFQGLVNAVFGLDVVLAVLPAGGGNDFAAALQMPTGTVEAAKAILRGHVISIDLVRARTADGRTRLYAGGGGVGIDAEAARYASGAFRRLPGRSRYVAAVLRALRSYRPIQVRMEFPESETPTIEARVMLGAVLNTPTYGAGIKLAPDARLSDGLLDTVIVEELNWYEVLRVLPKLVTSGELRTPRITRVQARKIRLTTERPAEFHGDGETLGPTPVEIEVVPNGARVLAPSAARGPLAAS